MMPVTTSSIRARPIRRPRANEEDEPLAIMAAIALSTATKLPIVAARGARLLPRDEFDGIRTAPYFTLLEKPRGAYLAA